MKENKFQTKVVKQLKNQAAFIVNVHGHRMQKSGLPDLLIVHKDWKGWLELKTGKSTIKKNQASAIQRIQAAKIELRNMPVYVLRCVERDEGIYGIYCDYMLENFQQEVVETFSDLSSLLGILIKLELNKWNEG